VFFLCGLWHGASWTFVVWGLYHGTFLVLERLGLGRALARVWRPFRHAYLLLVTMVGWVFFRADTLGGAVALLAAMAGRPATDLTPFTVQWYLTPPLIIAIAAGCAGSLPIGSWMQQLTSSIGARAHGGWGALSIASAVGVALLFAASIAQIAARTYNPFIYFRF
jgi:alginate O-acetyltransferase complex protein AlgI